MFYYISNLQEITDLVNEASADNELIEIAEFLNDHTSNNTNTTDSQCVGVFEDPLDSQNISLRLMDCLTKALVFCEIEPDYEPHSADNDLSSLPCVPTSNRLERSTDSHAGIFL